MAIEPDIDDLGPSLASSTADPLQRAMTVSSVVDRLLRPHPNCIALQLGRGGKLAGSSWFPLLHLVWLFWVFAAPWFPTDLEPLRLIGTYATVPLFLWLYLRAWYGDRAHVVRYAAAITLLALLTFPLTHTWSYVIYASALFPFCTTPRRSLLWLAALLAVFYGVARLDGLATPVAVAAVATSATIGLLNLFFAINARRDAELRLSQQEVRRLAATAERERIGRDLHDLLGHTLSLIALKAELADKQFDRDPEAARAEVRELRQIARDSLTEVRAAVTGFRATGLAAERVSARLLLASSGIELHGADSLPPLPAEVDAALALCLREAVTNVHRHAAATRVDLSLQADPAAVELTVIDNGCGGIDDTVPGNGLSGIGQRVAALGGSLTIRSPRGRGTALRLRLPLPGRRP